MRIDIERLQSLLSEGQSSLPVRVVCSIVVGLCLTVRTICRVTESICPVCAEVVAKVRTAFCALVEDFTDAFVLSRSVGRGEFGALCPVAVPTKSLHSTSPPSHVFLHYPKPPTEGIPKQSSASKLLSWHHPPTFLSSITFAFPRNHLDFTLESPSFPLPFGIALSQKNYSIFANKL